MKSIDVLILAAGKGTRMPSPRPKVLQTLLGETMLTLVTATAAAMPRIGNIFTLVGNEAEMVSAEAARTAERLGRTARCIRQEQQLGTGHALMTAMPHLDGDGCLLVVNGDAPLLTPDVLNRFLDAADGADVAFLSLVLDNAASYGRVVRENGAVRGIVEAKDFDPALYGPLEDAHEVNTGIYLFSLPAVRKLLPHLSCENKGGEYYITDLVALALEEGDSVKGIVCGSDESLLNGVMTLSQWIQRHGARLPALEIEDKLLPWNDRTFTVKFENGECTQTQEPPEHHLKMGIGTLSTLLLGYKTAERLYELERIEGREEAVERLDDVLFHKIPYISDYI